MDVWPCRSSRASRCEPCSARYRRLIQRIASHRRPEAGGHLYLLTLTSPGDQLHYLPNGAPCPCTPDGGVDLSEWNPSAAGRWNHLRTVIRQEVPEFEFLRVPELQQRGALHYHIIVWSPVPLDRVSLRRKAIRCGFGHELDLAPIEPGSRKHAYYVGKYVTKTIDGRTKQLHGESMPNMPWKVDGLHSAPTFRSWSSSRRWGLTMAECRAALRAAALANVARQAELRARAEALGIDLDTVADVPSISSG